MSVGLRNTPEFDMFTPHFISDSKSFSVRMPTSYAQILLTLKPFTCGDVVKYQLQPKESEHKSKSKKVDTGDFWAHVHIHPFSVIPQNEAMAFIKAQFLRVQLNPVAIEPHKEKQSGTGTNKIRVGFLPMETFDPRNLKPLAKFTAPDGSLWYTHMAKIGAQQLGVHHKCLGIQSSRAPFHIRCNCGDDQKKANQSTSAAHRAKATEAYQQRALKRAREEEDPFA